jgi:F0F1-type ATP synthase membrane subunit b/b'
MDQNHAIENPADATGAARAPTGGAAAATLTSSFLDELARAMHAAAARERDRIGQVIVDDAAVHVDKTRARAAAESDELRRLAEQDVERIQTWSETEIERIRREAERRTEERRRDLDAYLSQHDSIIATELDGVEVAVRDYQATLSQYFDDLVALSDPADIARRAGSLPQPPDLDAVRATARAGAVAQYANAATGGDEARDDEASAGPPVASGATDDHASAGGQASVGVMDPEAIGRSDQLPTGGEGDAEGAPEVSAEAAADAPAPPPDADPLHVPAEDAVERAVVQPPEPSGAAIRLLRTIAPWTVPPERDAIEGNAQPPH